MPTDIARYSIELFKREGEGIEQVIDRHADIKIARLIYRTSIKRYPGRLIMLATALGCSPAATGPTRCGDRKFCKSEAVLFAAVTLTGASARTG